MREATLKECYQALRQNGLDPIGSAFYSIVLYLRRTQIVEE